MEFEAVGSLLQGGQDSSGSRRHLGERLVELPELHLRRSRINTLGGCKSERKLSDGGRTSLSLPEEASTLDAKGEKSKSQMKSLCARMIGAFRSYLPPLVSGRMAMEPPPDRAHRHVSPL
jgi:hypothetical protein